jgi:phage-related protein
MNVLSLAANADRQKLASGDQWLILLAISWNGQYIRLARNNEPVTFDAGDGFGPMVYQPFAFDIESHTPTGAQLPTVLLKASNVNRMLQGIVEQYQGAVGAIAFIYVVNTANPSGEPDLALQMTILDTSCTAQAVTFSLGARSPLRNLFPRFTYQANYCMWKYKSKQCGYTGNLPTCALTLDGSNGCQAHNNQTRFGGFPGIGTNGAAIASQI